LRGKSLLNIKITNALNTQNKSLLTTLILPELRDFDLERLEI